MATTITINDETKHRLDDYKMGKMTYDTLLNAFMDTVSIEEIAERHIKEHYKRLETFKGISKDNFKKRLRTNA